jgi:3-oxoacyl-[acyl-carrier-protein] synthase-3
MRYENVHIVGLGVELGELISSDVAIADGRFELADAAKTAQRSVSCSSRRATDLAIAAGRAALRAAQPGTGFEIASELSIHLHASVCGPGIEVWSPSCYVLNGLVGAGPMLSAQLNTVSNGCLAAIELAAHVLTARDQEADYALVTAADCFVEPDFPRWSTERGLVFGDGAGAVVLGRRPGIAELLTTASYTDASMEGLHRGDEEVIGGGRPHSTPINLRARSRAHIGKVGGPQVVTARHAAAVMHVVGRVLDAAGVTIRDLARTVLPFFGRDFIEREYLGLLGIREEDTLLGLGLLLGHLGAGDQIVGLHHLVSAELVTTGDLVMLLGVGAGFTWTAALVRIE